MRRSTKEEVIQKLTERYPNSPFELLEYTACTQPVTIKCLSCGKILHSSSLGNFCAKQTLCTCLNPNSPEYKHERNKARILELCDMLPNIEWVSFGYREKVKKYSVQVKCLTCDSIFDKDWESFLLNQTCPHCNSGHNLNAAGLQVRLPEEYSLISDYHGTENKVLIRHKCGFIWSTKPHVLLQKIRNGYTGCPHCNHKKSAGEQRIAAFLEAHSIKYYNEYIFSWSSNPKFRYDFYIPDYNLIIEYMGEQHYKEVNFYHDTLEERQEHDKIKEKEARQQGINYLIIPYTQLKNIDTILLDWFNDYPVRE